MSKNLSEKQKNIYEFLKKEIKVKGYPPSIREICKAVNLSSTSTVHAHLSSLEKKGFIRRSPTKNRSIEILEENFYSRELVNIPIVGRVTAGEPILAIENIEDTFAVSRDYIHNDNVFMLRIVGDSMINVGILNNDLVIVNQQPSANNGDIVIALIDDSATCKTFYREKDYIRLQPENPVFQPILEKEVIILGKVVGLFRKF